MTKTTRRLAAAYTVAALFMAIGCGTPGRIPPPIEDDVRLLNDWKMVVQVSEQEGVKVRKLVGYLNKQYSEADPEGIVYVLDDRRNRVGFVLPTGQAYAFEIELQVVTGKRDLGNFDFHNGVKKVLGLTGTTLEYQPVIETGGPSVVPRTESS